MGTIGCKNCNNDKFEDKAEEMKIPTRNEIEINNKEEQKQNLGENYGSTSIIEGENNKSNKISEQNKITNKVSSENEISNIKLNEINCNENNTIDTKKEEFLKKTNQNIINSVNFNNFIITSKQEAKRTINDFEIEKIQFGIEKEEIEKFTIEEEKLLREAENNLNRFYPADIHETNNLQKVIGNVILNLRSFFSIINQDVNKNENIILFNGNLKKMINYEIKAHKPTMYSERFVVLYPKMVKYYRSQASFLKGLNPMSVIPLTHISRINIVKPKKSSKKIDHVIICNKLALQKNIVINNSTLVNIFDGEEINEIQKSGEINESLLIFTSDDDQLIFKFYVIMQYLLENYRYPNLFINERKHQI